MKKSQIMIGRGSIGYRKEQNPESRNSEHREKAGSFDRRTTRQSQPRVNTTEDCLYKKFQTTKTAQKPKHLFIYDTNFDDCKNYAGPYWSEEENWCKRTFNVKLLAKSEH